MFFSRRKYSIFIVSFWTLSLSISFAHSPTDSLIQRGIALYDQGKYAESIDLYKKALSLSPHSLKALYELSLSHKALKEYDLALLQIDKVIKSAQLPLIADAYIVKSLIFMRQNKQDAATQLIKSASEKYPKAYQLQFHLAWLYTATNQSAKAIKILEQCIANGMQTPELFLTYGHALIAQKRYIEAFWSLNTFLLMEPDGAYSKEAFTSILELLENHLSSAPQAGKYPREVDMSTISSALEQTKLSIPSEADEKTSYLLFQEQAKVILAELQVHRPTQTNSIFWQYITPIFFRILDAGYFNTFCRYITACYYTSSLEWWKSNPTQVDSFSIWFDAQGNLTAPPLH